MDKSLNQQAGNLNKEKGIVNGSGGSTPIQPVNPDPELGLGNFEGIGGGGIPIDPSQKPSNGGGSEITRPDNNTDQNFANKNATNEIPKYISNIYKVSDNSIVGNGDICFTKDDNLNMLYRESNYQTTRYNATTDVKEYYCDFKGPNNSKIYIEDMNSASIKIRGVLLGTGVGNCGSGIHYNESWKDIAWTIYGIAIEGNINDLRMAVRIYTYHQTSYGYVETTTDIGSTPSISTVEKKEYFNITDMRKNDAYYDTLGDYYENHYLIINRGDLPGDKQYFVNTDSNDAYIFRRCKFIHVAPYKEFPSLYPNLYKIHYSNKDYLNAYVAQRDDTRYNGQLDNYKIEITLYNRNDEIVARSSVKAGISFSNRNKHTHFLIKGESIYKTFTNNKFINYDNYNYSLGPTETQLFWVEMTPE